MAADGYDVYDDNDDVYDDQIIIANESARVSIYGEKEKIIDIIQDNYIISP